ncbi:MAG: transglycosylase SLT domain-containing protein [Neisseria sp.]|nr:transglycosylase SLT domain-containing protein [Neisseria sp.]
MSLIPKSALTIAGLSLFSFSYAQHHHHVPKQVGLAFMQLNAKPLDPPPAAAVFLQTSGGSVWNKLRSNFRMSEVNSDLIRRHENRFMNSRAYFSRTIERSRPYMYHISNEVAKRNMPAEIALLPFIESAFVTKAKSHVGASGLWQFMPATGRHYGLEQTPMYDGRHDIYAATNAALNYLEYLHRLFGDWSLALAAYNWGEGNVGRAINRALAQGLEPTYENLKMPAETRNYVPKLLAVRNIVNNPNAYGIRFSDVENKPYFQAVNLNRPIDISAITRLAQISEAEFLKLNPAFKTPVYLPKQGRKLLLPAANASTFERNFQNADKDSLLSWHVYTPYSKTHISDIAAESGMSVGELKSLNGLRTNNIPAGHSILVSKNFVSSAPQEQQSFSHLDTDRNPNDNKLQTVPPLQHNTTRTLPVPTVNFADAGGPTEQNTSARLQTAHTNAPAANIPHSSAVLPPMAEQEHREQTDSAIIPTAKTHQPAHTQAMPSAASAGREENDELLSLIRHKTSAAANRHRVEAGDTLYNIAKRYNMSVQQLAAANRIQNNTVRIGQILKVGPAAGM